MEILTICINFDGVIHSYKSGWQGPRCIPDPPVDGAIKWLRRMLKVPDFKISLYSKRSHCFGARRAMRKWLRQNGLSESEVKMIDFPKRKPPAHLMIDDRCMRFRGIFPRPNRIRAFRPWVQE